MMVNWTDLNGVEQMVVESVRHSIWNNEIGDMFETLRDCVIHWDNEHGFCNDEESRIDMVCEYLEQHQF